MYSEIILTKAHRRLILMEEYMFEQVPREKTDLRPPTVSKLCLLTVELS